jgi:hypothetical protein
METDIHKDPDNVGANADPTSYRSRVTCQSQCHIPKQRQASRMALIGSDKLITLGGDYSELGWYSLHRRGIRKQMPCRETGFQSWSQDPPRLPVCSGPRRHPQRLQYLFKCKWRGASVILSPVATSHVIHKRWVHFYAVRRLDVSQSQRWVCSKRTSWLCWECWLCTHWVGPLSHPM